MIAIMAFSATWLGFGSTIKWYFKRARERTPAKTALLVCGYLGLVIQFLTLCLATPASVGWVVAGVVCYLVANSLFWSALAAHGKAHPAFAFINVAPSALTTAGPYRLVRHPIYSAYLLAWLAGAVISAQPALLATFACMAVFYTLAARQEERNILASDLGTAYCEYRQRTGMFFPKFGGQRTPPEPQPLRKAG
jgi:protein-S-isoprenylcysteine O-methyltransferase Ste14